MIMVATFKAGVEFTVQIYVDRHVKDIGILVECILCTVSCMSPSAFEGIGAFA